MARMPRIPAIVALSIAAWALPLNAHDPREGEFTCPICREGHVDVFLGPWPFYIAIGGLGPGPALRGWSYMSPGRYWAMCCPHCGYCNTIDGFHLVYLDTAKARENPFAEPAEKRPAKASSRPSATRPEGQTRPATDAAASQPADEEEMEGYRRHVRLFPARPLEYLTIRANLRKSVDPRRFRHVNAYVPERLDIMLRTLPGWTNAERFQLAVEGSWACDDCGETAMSLAFLGRAVEAGERALRESSDSPSSWARVSLRYKLAEMRLRLGRGLKEPDVRAAGRAGMGGLLKDVTGIRKRAERRKKQLEGRITELEERIRQRLRELGLDPEAAGKTNGGLFDRPPAGNDEVIARLRRQIDELKAGKPGSQEQPASAPTKIEEMPLWALESDTEMLPALKDRIAVELAADAMRELSVDQAISAARKGGTVERTAFLRVHGAALDRRAVKEYVRELMAPLCTEYLPGEFWGGRAVHLFGEPREQTDPEKERLLGTYLVALAQADNRQRTEYAGHVLVARVLTDRMECSLPDPAAATRPSRRAEENEWPLLPRKTISVKMVPANADLIRKTLAVLEDRQHGSGLFDFEEERYTRDLCRVDAPWMAEIMLDDMSRRPRHHLRFYFDYWRVEDEGETSAESALDWPWVLPGRLVARYLPDRARQAAKAALARLEARTATPEAAAAALIPLHYLTDAESLDILRRAARRTERPVLRTAAGALLPRGESLAMDVLLDDAVRTKRPSAMPSGTIALLNESHLPRLRALLKIVEADPPVSRPASSQPATAEAPEDPYALGARTGHPAKYRVLAALAHLGDRESLRRYNAFAFQVQTEIGSAVDIEEQRKKAWLYHTPVTARVEDLGWMLRLAAWCYCTEEMAKELLDGAKLLPHGWRAAFNWWMEPVDVALLRALAANPRTHASYRRLAAELAARPAPLSTKQELMRNARRIPVAEVTGAMRRWASSDLPSLARQARRTLGELKP